MSNSQISDIAIVMRLDAVMQKSKNFKYNLISYVNFLLLKL